MVEYKNNRTVVLIICPIHGKFKQTPWEHLSGCKGSCCASNKKVTSKEFLNRAIIVHGNKYDYSKMNYKNLTSLIKIKCNYHNSYFKQTPDAHLRGANCPKCGRIQAAKNNTLKCKEEFESKARIVHGDLYDYSEVNYVTCKTKVNIICKKHGVFPQTPDSHLNGSGCERCRAFKSQGELAVEYFLNKNIIPHELQYKFKDCINIRSLKFDFYLHDYNTCIEYDGQQHFNPIDIFGGKKSFNKLKKLDKIKNKYCKSNNIKLIRIPYWDFNRIEEILTNELDLVQKTASRN